VVNAQFCPAVTFAGSYSPDRSVVSTGIWKDASDGLPVASLEDLVVLVSDQLCLFLFASGAVKQRGRTIEKSLADC
jgi:hypothetical protein